LDVCTSSAVDCTDRFIFVSTCYASGGYRPTNSTHVVVCQGTPAVMETYVDSKKEVDSHLKRTCEEFIHSITRLFIGTLSDFLTKVCVILCLLLLSYDSEVECATSYML